MKGQTMEMMGFLILAVTIIVVILYMRTHLAGTYGRSFSSLVQRQEVEGFRAGATTVLQTTEEKTGKSLLELLGIASYNGAYNLNNPWEYDFGPGRGVVNLRDEITWRMDEIYGQGKWYIKIPFPDVIPRYQMVMIVDSSGSLCDDFQNIKNNLKNIVEKLRQKYNLAVTIYMLPGGQECCGTDGGKLMCEGLFETEKYLHCIDLDRNSLQNVNKNICRQEYRPINNEDWGRGLACAVEIGPYEGWYDFTAKIGVILSDELTTGSENFGNPETSTSLEIGILAARGTGAKPFMNVFPLKAYTGKDCCPDCNCENPDQKTEYKCPLCPEKICSVCVRGDGIDWQIFNKPSCRYESELISQMDRLASETMGERYNLNDNDVSRAIEEIFKNHDFSGIKTYIDLGTEPLNKRNLNSIVVPAPVPYVGGYANVYIYTWV
ncbi:MAG: hypothetical protein QXY45_00980 [Candidatus Aenigmatarchaeota archaeon]